tara:strand:- start:237 stop:473 length:237 start_codon:yes stop_codon:yes gene_type:complete
MQGLNGISMKFILTMYVCSFLHQDCAPGVIYPEQFNSWYDCTMQAHVESTQLLMSIPQALVEENRIATKYTCTQLTDA